MVVDDIHFMNIFIGKRIKVTLRSSSYIGVVKRINPNRTLVLADVVSGSYGCKYPGSKMFFGHEILNVEFFNEANTDRGHIHDLRGEVQLNVQSFQPYRQTVTLDDEDEDEYINFLVIDEFNEKFGPALMHIKKQHVIGVGADGVEMIKQGRLSWLQIATKSKIYLFDILILGARAFKNGLSIILENKNILKVLHDCRDIAGCLFAHFGVKMSNVFDTQVADVMCFYSETGGFFPDRVSTLQEVVSFHLKVPSSQLLSLQVKSQLAKEEMEMFYKRPCPVPLLKVMALSVIHLLPLRLMLMDKLMTDYMALVDSYLNSSHYRPDEVEHINMDSMLELPRELRQLEQMHCERQQWAIDHYPITEKGLLARFNPRNQSQSQTSPAAKEQSHTNTQSRTQADSVQTVAVESLYLTQMDCKQPLMSQFKSSDVSSEQSADDHASHVLPTQAPVQGTVSDLRKEMSSVNNLSVGEGRGHKMNIKGRGRPFGREQPTLSSLPAIGRGVLQIPTHITQESARMETTPSCPSFTCSQVVMEQPASSVNDLPKDSSSLRVDCFAQTPQSTLSFLRQSFRSLRF
ncbi:piRNA biogenesis protein EXD1 [Channa argus]|uniref:piRNA biogenesis protein EXD1 n=1 Tax=Channa argus TaxID=215402 RepID=UPI0029460893|nr:hypothetical protein Q8A73_017361 [Channa argus]